MVTRRQMIWLKYTKFNFFWGYAPDSVGAAYDAFPDI